MLTTKIWADQVIFKDDKITKGKVLRVSKENVEVDPDGDLPFILISRKKVKRIIYSNGKVVHFTKAAKAEKKIVPEEIDLIASFEWGWNSSVGAGVKLDYRLLAGLTVNGGVGIGLWGYRFNGGLKYFFTYPYHLALGVSASINSGSMGQKLLMLNLRDSASDGSSVLVDEKATGTINYDLTYYLPLYDKNSLYLTIGYAYSLNKNPYQYIFENNNVSIKPDSDNIVKVISPGGLNVSIGYSILVN